MLSSFINCEHVVDGIFVPGFIVKDDYFLNLDGLNLGKHLFEENVLQSADFKMAVNHKPFQG